MPASLAHAAQRIERYRPTCVRADVLEPNSLPPRHFDSIALSFLLHCLPDGGAGKWRALTHLAPALQPDGVLFGSTIISDAPLRRQRWLMNVYNRKGIFSNATDTADLLARELEARFGEVVLETVGAVAFFAASKPRH